jgi:hypothetical protein
MATSPLFGWEEPDDVDLVKDGAAAIRTLGNAIDTSMGDLLGGTTGQVLSKASNTNMDFTWVAQDDSNAIQNAIVDAKGDLIAATAADTPARLAVGSNDTLLVADSTASTGLKWAGAWTTWSPSVSGFTLGNGTQVARYCQIGKTVFIEYSFTMGSTSTFTGLPVISLPVNYKGSLVFAPIGSAEFEDRDIALYWGRAVIQSSSNNLLVYLDKTDATYDRDGYPTSTVPFTWGTNDRFFVCGTYEAN